MIWNNPKFPPSKDKTGQYLLTLMGEFGPYVMCARWTGECFVAIRFGSILEEKVILAWGDKPVPFDGEW